MTITEPEEQGRTAPIELPTPPATAAASEADAQDVLPPPARTESPLLDGSLPMEETPIVARAASPIQQEVMYIPLAVTIGDGFKFGCGFFLASVLVMLVGFVLVAALFVLTSLFGLSLPISR